MDMYYTISSVVMVIFVLLIIVLSFVKNKKVTPFGISWIFVTLAPSCLVAISAFSSTPLAERYLYIPSAGYCFVNQSFDESKRRQLNAQGSLWHLASIYLILFFTVERQKGLEE
jgi:hypothetical protein